MRVCKISQIAIPIAGAATAELIFWNQASYFIVFLVTSIDSHFRYFQFVSSFSTGVLSGFPSFFHLGLDDYEREREREELGWTIHRRGPLLVGDQMK